MKYHHRSCKRCFWQIEPKLRSLSWAMMWQKNAEADKTTGTIENLPGLLLALFAHYIQQPLGNLIDVSCDKLFPFVKSCIRCSVHLEVLGQLYVSER